MLPFADGVTAIARLPPDGYIEIQYSLDAAAVPVEKRDAPFRPGRGIDRRRRVGENLQRVRPAPRCCHALSPTSNGWLPGAISGSITTPIRYASDYRAGP